MHIIDFKGKRYWSVMGPVSSEITAQKFWPTTNTIFTVLKTRPDITGLKNKYLSSGKAMYYFETKILHTLVVTPDDLLELYSLNKQRQYNDMVWFTQDDILELYNQKHNTQFRYVSYGREYNQVCRDLRFDNVVNVKFSIADLPDDWKVMFEVYTYQDFTRINSYTPKELERLEADKKAKANKDIFNTFLKSQVEKTLEEFGLYYNDFYETFRFKTVKDFRLFLQKAINDIICAKLKAKGINCKDAIQLKGVRSCKIDCETIDIIDASDITLTEEETSNE